MVELFETQHSEEKKGDKKDEISHLELGAHLLRVVTESKSLKVKLAPF